MLFALSTQDSVDGIWSATAGLVIVAHLHFAQQADREKIQTTDEKAQSRHHQRR